MVKKDGAAASIEENAEVQAPAEEQSNVQSSTAESVETQAPNEEDAEMQALFEGLDGNEPEQSGAEETAPKGKPTRADVLREARRRRAERSESVRAYQEFLIGLSSLTVAAKNHSIVNGLVSHIEQRNDVDSEVPCVMIIALVEGRYKVSIPFDEFYQKNPIDMATVNMETKAGREEYVNRCATMAAKLYSLNVPMVITMKAPMLKPEFRLMSLSRPVRLRSTLLRRQITETDLTVMARAFRKAILFVLRLPLWHATALPLWLAESIRGCRSTP